jgi:O-antigen/teichoic acid export membrane protein
MARAVGLKQFSQDTLFYGIGSILQAFISFLLFPIYTRVLTQEDYGAQDLALTAYTASFALLMLGLDNGAVRDYYDADTPEEKTEILSTWLWFVLGISVPVCGLLIAFAEPISQLLFVNARIAPMFSIAMALVPFALVGKIMLMALRLTFRTRPFALISVGYSLISAVFAIIFVVSARLGANGVLLSYLVGNGFQVAVGMLLTRRYFRRSFSRKWLKSMLAFGLPALPAGIALWMLTSSNRYYLTRSATLSDIGVLSAAVRISQILSILLVSFQIAFPPFAFSLIKDEQAAKGTYATVLSYFLLGALVVCVGLGLFAREVLLALATSSYEAASVLVPLLAYGAVALVAADIVGMGFSIRRKSYHITLATVSGGAVVTALNILLIPTWGVIGAAMATLISSLVVLGYSYAAGQHYFTVSYEFLRLVKLVGAAAITTVAGLLLDRAFAEWSPALPLYKFALYGLFVTSLFVLRVVGQREITTLRNLLSGILRRQ